MSDKQPKRFVRIEYATARTSHYACFDCRKQFRKPTDALVSRDWAGKIGSTRAYDAGLRDYRCPQCGKSMTHMGKNFRPPIQTDKESWEIARVLAAEGYKHSRHTGYAYPEKLKDVPDFLEQHRQLSEGERLLKKWSKDS